MCVREGGGERERGGGEREREREREKWGAEGEVCARAKCSVNGLGVVRVVQVW